MDDEPPRLVQGWNDECVDLRVERGKILSLDVPEHPDPRVRRGSRGDALPHRPLAGDPELAALEAPERLEQHVEPLALDQPAHEEKARVTPAARPRALRRPLRDERRDRGEGDPVLVDSQGHEVANMTGAVREAGVCRPHEVTHPRTCDPPRPRRLRPVEAAPPGHDRPALSAARGERHKVGGRRPDPAPTRNDDVRLELRERPERPLRHVNVGVEARAEAGSRSKPCKVERPGVEQNVGEGKVPLGRPASVSLHRRLGDHQQLAFVASRDPLEQRLRVRGDHVHDHCEAERPLGRPFGGSRLPSARGRAHGRGPIALRPSSPSHPRTAFGLMR